MTADPNPSNNTQENVRVKSDYDLSMSLIEHIQHDLGPKVGQSYPTGACTYYNSTCQYCNFP